MEIVPITIFYILLSAVVIFGVMFLIRRNREKEAGRNTTNKVEDIKEEESEDKDSR
jgi:phosphotransferase system  glucose/maltose/N-acetylglucosamine-specific IIC component